MRAAILLAGAVALATAFLDQAHAEGVTFTVATNGNDAWSGKLAKPNDAKTDGPFATIERARDEIRRMKQNGALPKGGVAVEVLAGRYELAKPVELTAEDSGTAESPIIYRALPGDPVHISGGRVLTDWKPVADPAALNRLDSSARGKVFQADLRALGITEYGDLGLDAEAQLQLWLARVDSQGEDAMGSAYASAGKKVRPRLEVFFNDQPMEISRWPNDDFIKIEEVLGKTEINVRGVKGCKEGVFVYEGDRPKRWVNEKDAWVLGYWFRDWAQQRHKITSLDTEKRIITVPPPYHQYGYRKGQWFRGFNLLCEIDEPGEWYIDREAGILYFWPPGKLDGGRVEVSMAPRLLTLTDTAHVTVRGLLFEAARGTAIAIKNGQYCRVVGCTFRNLGNHAVTVFDGKENGVVGCDMYGMGGGGIYLVGGDRKALTPAGHFAENNHIHHFGRWDRMYRPGIFLSGVGLRASHNLIHDAPHSAILFGGNDHLIEFNEIHNVCFESHDCGAIYAGRSWTLRGHVIQHNYLHHIYGKSGGPCNGIYLDDLFSSATVQGNIFHQVLRPVFLGGGRDNIIQNNVFVDCPKAMHIDARALGWCGPHADGRIKEAIEKGTIAGVRYKEPPFSTRYPQLVNLLDDEPKKPKGNIVRRNIFWQGTGENLRRVAKGQPIKDTWWDAIEPRIKPLVKLENNLINEDPKFVDEKAGNFQLRENSPAWKLGFQRIPVEKIGLHKDDCRASWPVNHPVRVMTTPAALKLLVLGNSITRHGPKKDIGWSGNWGMAASAEEKDFAHLVAHGLGKTAGAAPEVMIKNIAEFERQFAKYDAAAKLKDAFGFGADIIVIAIGENVPGLGSDEAKTQFRDSLRKLLRGLKAGKHPTLIVRSCFWPNQAKDQILKQVCQEVNGIFVDIGPLAKDESNYARSERKFSHAGVAAHPGDKGMQAIATAIVDAISNPRGKKTDE
ncbi:MAG: right-handed parallel beta-helix repeat-containing protein [Verrucomicrobia bacterium]|nr:right-handed parallel beta-helix repeat-containing protein [Verrucomicrobiota bacterium]